MRNYLPRVDWMVGTGLIGFLGRTVMMRGEKEGAR